MLSFLIAAPAAAQAFPQFTGLVVDRAALIPDDQERRLQAMLEHLQRDTWHQMAVVTVPSLQGRTVEAYALALARRWGVGRRGSDDGVLLLVAPRERQVRIEVGRGLERTLTDARCAAIIRRRMLPRFRVADAVGAIMAGVDALAAGLRTVPREGMPQ